CAHTRVAPRSLPDPTTIDGMVRETPPRPGQAMVEIGPGLAALTQPLVERLGRMHVIELDRDLAARLRKHPQLAVGELVLALPARLRKHPQLAVVEADVLTVDFGQLARDMGAAKVRVVGNL